MFYHLLRLIILLPLKLTKQTSSQAMKQKTILINHQINHSGKTEDNIITLTFQITPSLISLKKIILSYYLQNYVHKPFIHHIVHYYHPLFLLIAPLAQKLVKQRSSQPMKKKITLINHQINQNGNNAKQNVNLNIITKKLKNKLIIQITPLLSILIAHYSSHYKI